MTHKETAKKFGIKYRIGKYGFQFLTKDPDGHVHKLVSIVPLDGWLFGNDFEKTMKKRNFDL